MRPFPNIVFAVPALSAVCLAADGAGAQPFESIHGDSSRMEQAGRGARAVRHCQPRGGTIAVGVVFDQPITEVYLVRQADDGSPLWERAYTLLSAADGTPQGASGQSLVELRDGSGFVIAGTTSGAATGEDVFLMKVDCDGREVWRRTYAGPGLDSAADVIEAADGDLVAAGYTGSAGLGDLDGLLLRTDPSGGLLWSHSYDVSHAADVFHAVIETRSGGPQDPHDIVAVGLTGGVQGGRGLVLRVRGSDGRMAGGSQCAATYGAPPLAFSRFRSVRELQVGALAGHLVMAGVAADTPTAGRDIYLVHTRANPCSVVRQRRIGEPSTASRGEEDAYDLREVRTGEGNAVLALTGWAGNTTSRDAFLLRVGRLTLQPVAGGGRLFGASGAGREIGWSLARVPGGFLIAGSSSSDFQHDGDRSDLYIVRTDAAGHTPCAIDWTPPAPAAEFSSATVHPIPIPVLRPGPLDSRRRDRDATAQVCQGRN